MSNIGAQIILQKLLTFYGGNYLQEIKKGMQMKNCEFSRLRKIQTQKDVSGYNSKNKKFKMSLLQSKRILRAAVK